MTETSKKKIKISMLTKGFSISMKAAMEVERRMRFCRYKIIGNKYKAWTCSFPIGGHQDVVDSFLKGAALCPEVEILVNPRHAEARGTIVYVPSGWRALRDAIKMRRDGEIAKLIAGPTVCDLPWQYGGIIADPAVDVCLTPSVWVERMFRSELGEAGDQPNIKVYPSGIDENYWRARRAEPAARFEKALIYIKNSGAKKEREVRKVLNSCGKETRSVVNRKHVPQEYKELLEWCDFVVVLGESETQGIAMLQAWSMNRQTLVYDSPVISTYHRNAKYGAEQYASPCPYLCEYTGAFWKNTGDLVYQLKNMGKRAPREWVLKNMTNEITFLKWLEIVKT